jgi:uncharacterized protein
MTRFLTAKTLSLALGLASAGRPGLTAEPAPARDYLLQPVPFTQTEIADGFWTPRIDKNRIVTVQHNLQSCERTGRVQNFVVAARKAEGAFQGVFGFDDSDVYKVIEGAAYTLGLQPDAQLDRQLDDVIAKIAAAQAPDGYLYTVGQIGKTAEKPICCVGMTRWVDERTSHELYNAGHLFEAAVAHYEATGKRNLLDVATKEADLLIRVFGPGKNMLVPGHEEVEMGLVKLYRVTGKKDYLELARFFLDQRGNAKGHELYGPYNQDHMPVIEQSTAVGHAVRAAYLYSGMADVAALTGAEGYVPALDRIWSDVVATKLYVTGGIGAEHEGEAMGDEFHLPNRTAYAETCAAIANAMWNYRLFRLHGDAKYIDVLERTAYNAILSGVALSGDQFFYVNPLASDAKYAFNADNSTGRRPWFRCSCCPPNVARFLASFGSYVYAQGDDGIYVNLFVGGKTRVDLNGRKVELRQTTEYPWKGDVAISVKPDAESDFALRVRVPGWAREQPVPSDLYRYKDGAGLPYTLSVNGQPAKVDLVKGYAVLKRRWKAGDTVQLSLPMPVRRVVSDDRVAANKGRVAIERGPIVYAIESIDNGGDVFNVVLPDEAALSAKPRPDLLGGVTVITGRALGLYPADDGRTVVTREQDFLAVPYNVWSNRCEDRMAVWLPRRVSLDFEVP